jgi:hypothetical protein
LQWKHKYSKKTQNVRFNYRIVVFYTWQVFEE